jgi:hypothetical protein
MGRDAVYIGRPVVPLSDSCLVVFVDLHLRWVLEVNDLIRLRRESSLVSFGVRQHDVYRALWELPEV